MVSFLEDFFLKIIFLHGEIFEFSEFFFCLQILCNVNGKGTTVCHTPCSFGVLGFFILILLPLPTHSMQSTRASIVHVC